MPIHTRVCFLQVILAWYYVNDKSLYDQWQNTHPMIARSMFQVLSALLAPISEVIKTKSVISIVVVSLSAVYTLLSCQFFQLKDFKF